MKKVPFEKLAGMIERIDSREKAGIAEQFILECDLSDEQLDDLMRRVEQKYRDLEEIDYQDRCHRRGTHLPWRR